MGYRIRSLLINGENTQESRSPMIVSCERVERGRNDRRQICMMNPYRILRMRKINDTKKEKYGCVYTIGLLAGCVLYAIII